MKPPVDAIRAPLTVFTLVWLPAVDSRASSLPAAAKQEPGQPPAEVEVRITVGQASEALSAGSSMRLGGAVLSKLRGWNANTR